MVAVEGVSVARVRPMVSVSGAAATVASTAPRVKLPVARLTEPGPTVSEAAEVLWAETWTVTGVEQIWLLPAVSVA